LPLQSREGAQNSSLSETGGTLVGTRPEIHLGGRNSGRGGVAYLRQKGETEISGGGFLGKRHGKCAVISPIGGPGVSSIAEVSLQGTSPTEKRLIPSGYGGLLKRGSSREKMPDGKQGNCEGVR